LGRTSDVIVVGGGIAGVFVTYFLARRGVATRLIERVGIGTQASGNNPGGLNPLHGASIPGPLATLAIQSFNLHLEHGVNIEEMSGRKVGPMRATRVHLAFEQADLIELRQIVQLHDEVKGFSARRLTRSELLNIEPRLNASVIEGVLTEGNAVVDGHDYAVAVSQAAVAMGASVCVGNIIDVLTDGSRVTGVKCDSEEFQCGTIVFATGPWAQGPANWLGIPIDVKPLKGELLLAEVGDGPFQHDFTWQSAALYPVDERNVWLGGTEEDVGLNSTPSAVGRESILHDVSQMVPAARAMRVVRQIAALRPVTPDGLPVIGPATGWENAYLAMGGGRKGILLSSGMGHAVADLISSGSTSMAIQKCSPERFLHEG
jgi:glycine oxidase